MGVLVVWLLSNGACTVLVPSQPTEPDQAHALPPQGALLQLETGMHTALISRIGIDEAKSVLVTGSHDKTVRVWELATGRLLQVIRPAVRAGGEGKIYAVAPSPDGTRVAVGFRDASRVVLSAGDLSLLYTPDATEMELGGVSSVCWSADGQWLYAGGLHRVQGLYALRRWSDGGRGAFAALPV